MHTKRVIPMDCASTYESFPVITVEPRNCFLDDRPGLDVFKISHPNGEVFPLIRYTRMPVQLDFTEPDEIWAQCGIQFRAISCGTGADGGLSDDPGQEKCPDLNVTEGLDVSGNGVQCVVTPEGRVIASSLECGY